MESPLTTANVEREKAPLPSPLGGGGKVGVIKIKTMKNFIFDLYGTLADIHTDENSKKFIKAVSVYFKKLNPETGDFMSEYKRICAAEQGGEDDETDLSRVFGQLLKTDNGETILKAAGYFRRKSRSKLGVYGGVKRLLTALKEKGSAIYLLTNAQACFTLAELDKLKLTGYFDGIVISSEIGKKKPSPVIFDYALKKFNLDVGQTVFTGNDINADVLGAKAAGLHTAYILSNLSPTEDSLEKAKPYADFATDNFKSLSEYLISLC